MNGMRAVASQGWGVGQENADVMEQGCFLHKSCINVAAVQFFSNFNRLICHLPAVHHQQVIGFGPGMIIFR